MPYLLSTSLEIDAPLKYPQDCLLRCTSRALYQHGAKASAEVLPASDGIHIYSKRAQDTLRGHVAWFRCLVLVSIRTMRGLHGSDLFHFRAVSGS